MGRWSKAVFERDLLPNRCIIYAGSYIPQRKEWIRRYFDSWSRIRGTWIKYVYATSRGKEYLLTFNVYGASMIMELLYLLKDGNVEKLFFIGSTGGKYLSIGSIVLPIEVVEQAGPVSIEDKSKRIIKPRKNSLSKLRSVLNKLSMNYIEGRILSVPCVLHDITHIHELFEKDDSILGVELELSTFYYYSNKLGFEGYALLYISDNKKYDIISGVETVREARRKALKLITKIALHVI